MLVSVLTEEEISEFFADLENNQRDFSIEVWSGWSIICWSYIIFLIIDNEVVPIIQAIKMHRAWAATLE